MRASDASVILNEKNLQRLSPAIRIPTYERANLRQNTVHIGVGGFHRAHQAVYLDDLLSIESMERWGECGVGLLQNDARMRDALKPQDWLYAVVERSAHDQRARIIGSIADYLYAPAERDAAIERMAAPDCRIVSLTITEGGYFIDEGSGAFTEHHPDIQHDLLHSAYPVSSLGYLAEALDRRRQRGLPPFTIMSCDNLQGNGDVIRRVLLAFTTLQNPGLRQWIEDSVSFPNSMVDRITPATTDADREKIAERFGIADGWPVVTEPFIQWVIEDEFSAGRPRWEEVGAQIVTDVAPYEIMKMRLLNGSHLAMAYLGALAGYTYVHEVMQDPLFKSFIERFMEEVTPVVPDIPGTSITDYKSTLIQRFSNPSINDQVTRICSEGSAKMPKWIFPSLLELLRRGAPIELLSLVVAGWIQYFKVGIDEQGSPLQIIDARAGELRRLAQHAGTDIRPFLAVESIFGRVLPTSQLFVKKTEMALQSLSTAGTTATLRSSL